MELVEDDSDEDVVVMEDAMMDEVAVVVAEAEVMTVKL